MAAAMSSHYPPEPPGDRSGDAHASAEFLTRLREGDPQAWIEFEQKYKKRVLDWIRVPVPLHHDAEDVCQNVFLKVVKKVHDFERRGTGAFTGWISKITHRGIVDYFRFRRRQPPARGVGPDGRTMEVDDLPERNEAMPDDGRREDEKYFRIRQLVCDNFGEVTWEVLVRTVIDGETAAEVAAALELTVSAVNNRKSRGAPVLTRRASCRLSGAGNGGCRGVLFRRNRANRRR